MCEPHTFICYFYLLIHCHYSHLIMINSDRNSQWLIVINPQPPVTNQMENIHFLLFFSLTYVFDICLIYTRVGSFSNNEPASLSPHYDWCLVCTISLSLSLLSLQIRPCPKIQIQKKCLQSASLPADSWCVSLFIYFWDSIIQHLRPCDFTLSFSHNLNLVVALKENWKHKTHVIQWW